MLYYLIDLLEQLYQPPGFQAIYYITVRAALAATTSLFISLFIGKRIIRWLEKNQFGEMVREGADAGAVDHAHKAGTPSMGGIIILVAILGSTLLWGDLTQLYIQMILITTLLLGLVGFADDYIKIVRKDKSGLASRTKVIGQVTLGLFVGSVLYFHPQFEDIRGITNIPFIAEGRFDYSNLISWIGIGADYAWIIYIPAIIFILTAVSNGANLTDGLDGLATGVSAFVTLGLVGLCYLSGNAVYSSFLDIIYLPGAGEISIFAAAMAAACLGFLWYNGHPAQVFMGDTGSLALGGAIGTIAIMVRAELLLPILCGIFFLETLSVIIQTSYFKYTKKKTGVGKRVFKMAPIHHHYEAQGIPESKIVIRFWIVQVILVITTLLTLRIR